MEDKEIAMHIMLKLIEIKAGSLNPTDVGKSYQTILKAIKEADKEIK